MLGKLLTRLSPGSSEATDPEVIEHYKHEAEQRRAQIEEHRRFASWITEFMGGARERNHFGPDIELAIAADNYKKKGNRP